MSVLILFKCIALLAISVVCEENKIENKVKKPRENAIYWMESVTRPNILQTEIYTTSNIITSKEPYEEPTTDENSSEMCLPGQSAYNRKDLKSIINTFYVQHNFGKLLNESYYLKALGVRDKYKDSLAMFEKKFEDRPQHLKHILQDMVATRQRVEPIAKRIASLLNQFESYENSLRTTTKANVIKVLDHIEKSKKICDLNCGNETFDNNIITLTSTRGFYNKRNQVYCSTFEELSKTVLDRLRKFLIIFSDILENRINKDSIIFEEKITNIKNKLKTAAVEQFGLTMYDILNLQDEYFHFSSDLKEYNILNVLQDIKQNEYDINSKLLVLESNAKKYRNYCIGCIDQLVYQVRNVPRTEEFESLLDEVLNETTIYIEISTNQQYAKIFDELNQKLDETTIVDAQLSKLKPIKGEIEKEVKKEIDNFAVLQKLVSKTSIAKVFKLADESKELLRRVEDGLIFTKQYIH